jgi:hypothetical protein
MRWEAGGVRWVNQALARWIPFRFAQGRLSPRWRVRGLRDDAFFNLGNQFATSGIGRERRGNCGSVLIRPRC